MLKQLSAKDAQNVSGGFNVTLTSPAGPAIRTIPGAGAVLIAAETGWNIGKWLNRNTRIQALIRDLID